LAYNLTIEGSMKEAEELMTITRHSPPNEMDQLPLNSICLVSYQDGREETYLQKSLDDLKPIWVLK